MLLAIDAGNTNIVIGVFDGEELRGTWRVHTRIGRTPEEYYGVMRNFLDWCGLELSCVTAVCLCSVVPPITPDLKEMAERFFHVEALEVGANLNTNVQIAYEDKTAVGADRLVNAVAAYELYGGPCIVVDFGTATTFDAISRDGAYLGGAIAPGITISAEALFQRTAQLRRVDLRPPPKAIGTNTSDSMRSGLVFGYVGLVKELVIRFKQELEGGKVVATGGLADLIAPLTGVVDEINPNLTLTGLRLVYERNC